jgi:hypothetical protein
VTFWSRLSTAKSPRPIHFEKSRPVQVEHGLPTMRETFCTMPAQCTHSTDPSRSTSPTRPSPPRRTCCTPAFCHYASTPRTAARCTRMLSVGYLDLQKRLLRSHMILTSRPLVTRHLAHDKDYRPGAVVGPGDLDSVQHPAGCASGGYSQDSQDELVHDRCPWPRKTRSHW